MKPYVFLKRNYQRRTCSLHSSPQAVFHAVYGQDPFGFLYESLENEGERGRFSCLGGRPLAVVYGTGEHVTIETAGISKNLVDNPLQVLRNLLASCRIYPQLDMFCGGAVGYFAYDTVKFYERILSTNPDVINTPDYFFLFPAELISYDHKKKTIDIMLFDEDTARLDELCHIIDQAPTQPFITRQQRPVEFHSNMTEKNFLVMVERAQEYILSGDIFQVVLSQRLSCPLQQDPFSLYNALRITNPSPYMYFLKFNDLCVLGSSPETLVKLNRGVVTSQPIAGTRPRGATPGHDRVLCKELKQDEKERAEHVMLVDLARNDLGRICDYGSVIVTELMKIEQYSKVMHLTSKVIGKLKKEYDAFDVLSATFPAGTVSGAPKIRAMEIIDELEHTKRGIYAGAIGYCGYDGNMDMCIAIRTIVVKGRTLYIQGGAGIVADSIPQREYHETLHKMSALKKAVEIAQ